MTVEADDVRRIVELAKLRLDDTTVETFRAQLGSVLDYVAMLDEIDVRNVPPTFRAIDDGQPVRPDECRPSLSPERALANAPDAAEGHFRVPNVLDPASPDHS